MRKNWMYRLLEKPPAEGGDPGKAPADPPKGGDPKPKPEPPAAPATVPVDVLPEELRDRPAAEQKFILEHMVQSLSSRNREVEALKEKMANMEGRISVTPPKPAEPDPHEGKTLTELMLEDAEIAMDKYMESRGYVKAFSGLEERVGSAEYTMVRSEIPDFDEYEEDVQELLKSGNLPATRQNVMGAYTMAVGSRALAERQAARRSGGGSIPPSPPTPPSGGDEVKWKSSLEQEIAAAHGVDDPKDWYEHAGDKPMKLKLPT